MIETKTAIETLQEIIDIQCSDGNWDYDKYMHGLANGMILAMSCMTGEDPVFKEAPKVWVKDKKALETPSVAAPRCKILEFNKEKENG